MNFMKNTLAWRASALALLWTLLLTGCRSLSESETAGFASVDIRGHSTEEIIQTTAVVFREDGYTLRTAEGTRLTFEKDGSGLGHLAYGGWGSGAVVLRVRTELVPGAAGVLRLQCGASMVRYAGDRVLEDEQRLAKARRAPFQSLLDETARRLK